MMRTAESSVSKKLKEHKTRHTHKRQTDTKDSTTRN